MWTLVAAGLSLVPALCAWASGRRLVRLVDDPALPERLYARQHRLSLLTTVPILVAALVNPAYALWNAALAILALIVADYPLRKALYAESWGLGAYLSHVLRETLAGSGFWLLLALTPTLVQAAGPSGWPVALLLAGLLFAWEVWYPHVYLWLMRATPLDRPDLAERFRAILGRAASRPPRLYRAGPVAGRWVTAVAMPGAAESRVLFSETLLASFDPDELTAIFAHEVAHLEHYDRRRVIRLSVVNWLAIVAAGLAAPLAGSWAGIVSWAWLLAVLFGLTIPMASRKKHETDSDRRAVTLCGDAGALVRALVKLHVLTRLPRRWAIDFEQAASHPSLAHRLQAIQADAGLAVPPPGLPAVVAGRAAGAFVVLEARALHRLEGVPPDAVSAGPETLLGAARTVQSVAYAELIDLRVRTTLRGTPSLVGRGLAGRAWSVPLRADAVAATQAALDAVDVQLAHPPTGSVWDGLPAAALATGLACASLVSATWVVFLAAAVTLWRPTHAPLTALGVTALGGGLLGLFGPVEGPAIDSAVGRAGAAVLGALGGLTLAWARWRRSAEAPVPAAVTALGFGLLALYGWGTLAGAGVADGVFGLHRAARMTPSATLALLGVSGALASRPRGWARAGAAAAGLAIVPLVLASGWFLDRFGHDPLMARAAQFGRRGEALRLLHEARLSERAADLQLSPDGREYALWVAAPQPVGWQLRLGRFGGEHRTLEADQVVFLADGRLLVSGDEELRVVTTAAPEDVVWRRALPDVGSRHLVVDATTGAWRLIGPDDDHRQLIALAGVVGSDSIAERRWSLPERLREATDFVAAADAALAVQATGWQPPRMWSDSRWAGVLGMLSLPPAAGRELWLLDDGGARRLVRTRLGVRCEAPHGLRPTFVCLAYERAQAHVWEVHPGTGALASLGTLSGPSALHTLGPDGQLAVWTGHEVTLFAATGGAGVRLELPDRPAQVVLQRGWLGTLSRAGGGSVIRVYEVP